MNPNMLRFMFLYFKLNSYYHSFITVCPYTTQAYSKCFRHLCFFHMVQRTVKQRNEIFNILFSKCIISFHSIGIDSFNHNSAFRLLYHLSDILFRYNFHTIHCQNDKTFMNT